MSDDVERIHGRGEWTIWKFKLETTDVQEIAIPDDHYLLTVQTQYGVPCLWAKVRTGSPVGKVKIVTIGTGKPISAEIVGDLSYLGTYQLEVGRLVYHVFVLDED